MNVKITRKRTNRLYTQGTLGIHFETQTQTVEATDRMLAPGLYSLRLVSIHAHRRDLLIFDAHTGKATGQRISPTALSHVGCRREQAIAIGEELIPGALYKPRTAYERIVKRLEKCQQRGEPILLVIDDSDCHPSSICHHWLRTRNV